MSKKYYHLCHPEGMKSYNVLETINELSSIKKHLTRMKKNASLSKYSLWK